MSTSRLPYWNRRNREVDQELEQETECPKSEQSERPLGQSTQTSRPTHHHPACSRSPTLLSRRSHLWRRPAMTAPSQLDAHDLSARGSRLYKTTRVVGKGRKQVCGSEFVEMPVNDSTTTRSANQTLENVSQSIRHHDLRPSSSSVSPFSLPPPRPQKPSLQSQTAITSQHNTRQLRWPSSVTVTATPRHACTQIKGQDDKYHLTHPLGLNPDLTQTFLSPSRSFYRFRGNSIPVESDAQPPPKQLPDAYAGDISERMLERHIHTQSTIIAPAPTNAVTSSIGVALAHSENAPHTTTSTVGNTNKNNNKYTNAFAKHSPRIDPAQRSPNWPRLLSSISTSADTSTECPQSLYPNFDYMHPASALATTGCGPPLQRACTTDVVHLPNSNSTGGYNSPNSDGRKIGNVPEVALSKPHTVTAWKEKKVFQGVSDTASCADCSCSGIVVAVWIALRLGVGGAGTPGCAPRTL
ncbi:hypothetical protein D9619_004577 [Psilocybe cf. subviscida]|uniref:Uncharacterized protein n=1 Tax=Psilocybe cf. subviscida TaxID=2480587 RepID=A0A8H5BQR5_9AGAR|nr:hypothetical protein D9619_004577 [Psilocybe cf. subviscida]